MSGSDLELVSLLCLVIDWEQTHDRVASAGTPWQIPKVQWLAVIAGSVLREIGGVRLHGCTVGLPTF